jgi:hypothetical protein
MADEMFKEDMRNMEEGSQTEKSTSPASMCIRQAWADVQETKGDGPLRFSTVRIDPSSMP